MVRTNPRVPVFRRAYSLDKWYWFWNRTGNGPVKCDRPFPLNKACGQYINQSVIWWRKKSTFNACGATITQFDGKNCQVATINVFQSIFLTTCPFPLNKACGQYINQSVIWRKKTARKSTFNACGAIITQFDNKNCQITTINVGISKQLSCDITIIRLQFDEKKSHGNQFSLHAAQKLRIFDGTNR